MKRVAIFVDGNNLFHIQKTNLKWKIEPEKLIRWAKANCGDVIEAIYYTGTDPENDRLASFLYAMSCQGYKIESKPVKVIQDNDGVGSIFKANMDIEIAVDMVTMSGRYDEAILISGDGDFLPVIRYLKTQGKSFKVLSTSGACSRELRMAAGADYVDFWEIKGQIEKQSEQSSQVA